MVKSELFNKKQLVNFKKNHFENDSWEHSLVVCGIDEVGRGCLAGPLVTAAVILPPQTRYNLLKDSKILTEADRLKAYKWIIKNCFFGVGMVHNRIIDQHNIWQATLIAMKKALVNLLAICPTRPSKILVDAMPLEILDTNYKDIPIEHFPKGEQKSSSIAAASIVAKVTRDRLVTKLDNLFPGYHLAQHKGYATKKHQEALLNHGHSIIHRISFLEKLYHAQALEHTDEHQQTIC
ncbi:MAG: ribonuclease HII [bacterium]|nr:ribonuclease HII [bacterium]